MLARKAHRYLALLLFASVALAEPAARNRIVRIVSVSQADLDRRGRELLDDTVERLERAASFRPDIAALPEVFIDQAPETVPGPTTRRLADWARRHSSYLIFGIKTRSGDRVYNSAILLDRKGEVAGQYHKMHPTEGELGEGISPGAIDQPVFATDFGTIGIQICFDVNWWDEWKRLKEKGAKIVFFPAAFPAAKQLAALALQNQFFVVSSSRSRLSRVYDITGDVIATSGHFQPWASAAVPIGKRLFEIDFHTRKAREIQKKYGAKVDLAWHNEDDWFTLASLDPDLTVDDLIVEFGLLPLDAYRVRATHAIDASRGKLK